VRPWEEVADLPIAAAAVGNHDFDDGVDALVEATERLSSSSQPSSPT
jgi:2',3'-cyclic-nucleotide 2'-phosphodiesterase (5'-nucleotidase family)